MLRSQKREVKNMKGQKILGFLAIPAILVAGYLFVSPGAKAADEAPVASPEVTKLLASSETEAWS